MAGERGKGDCVIFGGTIYTMDPKRPRAEAVAIRDGRIVHVGDLKQASEAAGPRAEAINLHAKTALPGFVESHTHPAMVGRWMDPREVNCREMRSIDEIVEALKARAAATPPGQWIFGHSYDDSLLREQCHPTRRDLDRASTDHLILLTDFTIHVAAANSAALAHAGITAATPDPSDGTIDRFESGEPTGVLREGAQLPVRARVPTYTEDDIRRHLREAAHAYLARGITSVTDAGLGFLSGLHEVRAAMRFGGDDAPPIRYGAAIAHQTWQKLNAGADPGLKWEADPEWLRPVGVKLLQDGYLQGAAALSKPSRGQTRRAEEYLSWSQDDLDAKVLEAHSAGWQVWIHANGDLAIQTVLDAYANALRTIPRRDHRHRIEHCQLPTDSQMDRMANMGVLAGFFPCHIWYWGDRHWENFGSERAARLSPLVKAEERGIRFGMHCDSPFTPIAPLTAVSAAVNRRTQSGRLLGGNQRVAMDRALRLFTIDNAYLGFDEAIKGSLEEGKLGDVVVLEADPHQVTVQEIKDIPVAMTIVGGRVVFQSS